MTDHIAFAPADPVSRAAPPRATSMDELRDFWPILLACTLGSGCGVIGLVFYSSTAFMPALLAEFGWSRRALALGPTLLSLMVGLCAPMAGRLLDAGHTKAVLLCSMTMLAMILLALSRMQGSLWQFWLGYAAMGALGVGTTTIAYTRIIGATFDKMRGTALGIALSGTALAAAIAPGLVSQISADFGWRSAYLALAGIVAVLGPLASLPILISYRPAKVGAGKVDADQVGISAAQAWRSKVFWKLLLIFPLIGFSVIGLAVHLVPIMVEGGLTPLQAGRLAGVTGAVMLLSRLGSGVLMDRFFAPHVGAWTVALAWLALALLLTGDARLSWGGAAAAGLCVGVEFDLLSYLALRYFGVRSYGRIAGTAYSFTAIAIAVAAIGYGLLADALGSYRPGLFIALGLLALSLPLMMSLPRFRDSDALPYGSETDRGAR